MASLRETGSIGLAALAIVALGGRSPSRADTVTLKNGLVYRGTVDRDNTLVSIYDGLKRVVLRDSKIESIASDTSLRNLERFQLVQPLQVHAGAMPPFAYSIQSSGWDQYGRRSFRYVGSRSGKPVTMTQAINELGPFQVKLRGVDGFWLGQLATGQIPREVVLGLLAKVDPKDQDERLRVGRFLIQAEWYDEASAELDRLTDDFPEIRDRLEVVRQSIQQLQAERILAEIATRDRARQSKEVLARLKAFPTEGVSTDLLVKVRDQLREAEARAAADQVLAADLQSLAGRLPDEVREAWNAPIVEILRNLDRAPDAVRSRLDAFQKADLATTTVEARIALALTGWVVGAEAAADDLGAAENLWKARSLIGDYLRDPAAKARAECLSALQAMEWPDAAGSTRKVDPDTATRLAQLMLPPLHDDRNTPGEAKIYRVLDDGNDVPTEYAVLLPPEYHPLRSYPAVLALHSGAGATPADRMLGAVSWWSREALRRGYIVIAPEYNLPGKPADYLYTTNEHAAAELALRDAKRRFAIDGDRVFLGGQLLGGNMAWDYGLAHHDLFAGVAIISGLPAKYVDRIKVHAERLPMYIALGDLAPASRDVAFELAKGLILKAWEVTYVEYFKRGLEDLPEEAPAIFDWMDHRHPRDPYPRKFTAVAARECDDRFYGIVIRDFSEGRAVAPEAVETLGKNLKPATLDVSTSGPSNLIKVSAGGARAIDVWVGPRVVDFKKRIEVRINGRAYFKALPKPDIQPFLDDLRLRGDRQQIYWLKVSAG